MKITMYELLGMVKEGKASKKIKYDNMIWEYDGIYYMTEHNTHLDEYCDLSRVLNDEVEILEEEKKIPEKINNWISGVGRVDDSNIEEYVHKLFEQQTILYFKINEIIDYLKSKGE